MVYSDFAIGQLKERLVAKATKNSTPKKFGGDMFEAYEVIVQLQKQVVQLQKQVEQNKEEGCGGCRSEDWSRDRYPCNCCVRNEETLTDNFSECDVE